MWKSQNVIEKVVGVKRKEHRYIQALALKAIIGFDTSWCNEKQLDIKTYLHQICSGLLSDARHAPKFNKSSAAAASSAGRSATAGRPLLSRETDPQTEEERQGRSDQGQSQRPLQRRGLPCLQPDRGLLGAFSRLWRSGWSPLEPPGPVRSPAPRPPRGGRRRGVVHQLPDTTSGLSSRNSAEVGVADWCAWKVFFSVVTQTCFFSRKTVADELFSFLGTCLPLSLAMAAIPLGFLDLGWVAHAWKFELCEMKIYYLFQSLRISHFFISCRQTQTQTVTLNPG